ncbi:hypothetical protein FACS189440_10070 [Bacteroidia bacterium]|nr:hypothetical protein FACS189440_10070 [Bacteroidia bacterium]
MFLRMKKTPCFSTILIVLFFILSPAICAQSQIADSLINVLNTQKLTPAEQLELYKNITANLSEADPRKSDAYATKGLVLAKKAKDKEKMAFFIVILGMSYGRSGDVDKGIAYLETALTLVQKTKNEKMEADMYANIASIYLWKSGQTHLKFEQFIPVFGIK